MQRAAVDMSIKRRLDALERETFLQYDLVGLTPAEREELDAKISARVEVLVEDGSLEFTAAGCVATRPELEHIAKMFTVAMGKEEADSAETMTRPPCTDHDVAGT